MIRPGQASSPEGSLGSEVDNLEGVESMFPGAWCGQVGVGGWVLMGLFWVTFLGLVVWALSRLFAPTRPSGLAAGDADDLDLRLATGQLGPEEYRNLRQERHTVGRR